MFKLCTGLSRADLLVYAAPLIAKSAGWGAKKNMQIIKRGLLGLLVLIVAAVGVALWVYRDIPAAELEAKYAGEMSQFMELDGLRLHYRDEGEGPAVLLMHAHWASLIMWDSWADALKDDYRVLRYDMTSHGLTGPDPRGVYTMERNIELTEKFLDAMGVDELYIAGTSMGGTTAIRYTAKHPDKVGRLILLNPGALNSTVRGRDTPPELPWFVGGLRYITPRVMFSGILRSGFGDSEQVSEELITRWHDMQLREGQRAAEISRMRQYVSGDIEQVIRSLTTPTLVMWGEENSVVPIEQGREIVDMIENVETEFIGYAGKGHMTVLEAPEQTAADARAYFDEAEAVRRAPENEQITDIKGGDDGAESDTEL